MFMDELTAADHRSALDSRFAKESRRPAPRWSDYRPGDDVRVKKDRGRLMLKLKKELTFPAPLNMIHEEGVVQK